jgi:translation initiation factor 1
MSGPSRVYSTGPDGGRSVGEDEDTGRSFEPEEDRAPARHALRVRLEQSGRRGKQVSVVGPLILRRGSAKELLAALKRECGTGGTLKVRRSGPDAPAFELEIQGDHRDRLCTALTDRGFPVKQAGG